MIKKNINIIYVGNFDFDNDNAAFERARNNMEIFKKNKCKCSIVGFSNQFIKKKTDDVIYSSVKKPTLEEGLFKFIYRVFIYFLNLDRIEQLIENDMDNIIIMYNLPSILMKNIMKNFRNNAYFVSDVTEWYNPIKSKKISSLYKNKDISIRINKLNKQVDGLILVSEYLYSHYESCSNKILIPPLVDPKYFRVGYSKEVDTTSKTIFTYAGFPGGDKDRLDMIINCFADIKKKRNDFFLNVLGPTEEEILANYPEIKKDLSILKNNMIIHGRCEREKVIETLSQSDYTFLIRESSLRNNAGFPTKFSEAKTIGVSIIYSNFSDIAKYVSPYDINVEINSKQGLTNAILKSLSTKRKIMPSNIFTSLNPIYQTQFDMFFTNLLEKGE